MVWNDPALWAVAAQISLFALAAWHGRQRRWLGGALLLWLLADTLAGRLVPSAPSLRRLILLYAPQFYIAAASVCLLPQLRRVENGMWRIGCGSGLLTLYAVSGWVSTSAALLLAALVWWQYPNGITPYAAAGLMQLYFFQPLYWLAMQSVLMLLFYVHARWDGQGAQDFDGARLHFGLMAALAMQTACVLAAFGVRP
ncbi:hypothetical protein V9W64_01910 [Neisseria leonii]|uniref:Uncharacterized protein n=1 Tax=Neisseria leonii TaxID=2995413 RepID=A0A9X4E0D2_9NEIS|nr:hypothetical protein [Neisseria sp. 51.81]MDD9327127.1 hypothetical protein [Neisseria sp. 51.81]